MAHPKVYADFQNSDPQGRLRLNCDGTLEDLARQQIQLREGLRLTLYADDANDRGQADDLQVEGVVSYSEAEKCWVAAIEWSAIRHVSEIRGQDGNGGKPVAPEATVRGREMHQ